jgi:hypothetical protein
MNPLSQIDEKSEIPPQAQMKMQQQQKQIADMEQQMIAMQLEINNRGQVAQIREDGNNRRKLMDVISRAYNTDTINEARVNQANVKAVTDQNKTELDVMTRLVLAGITPEALAAEMERRNIEQQQAHAFAEMEVNKTANPFIQAGQELMQPQMQPEMPMQPGMQPPQPGMQQPMNPMQ